LANLARYGTWDPADPTSNSWTMVSTWEPAKSNRGLLADTSRPMVTRPRAIESAYSLSEASKRGS
jgi:hypothetical protein